CASCPWSPVESQSGFGTSRPKPMTTCRDYQSTAYPESKNPTSYEEKWCILAEMVVAVSEYVGSTSRSFLPSSLVYTMKGVVPAGPDRLVRVRIGSAPSGNLSPSGPNFTNAGRSLFPASAWM